MNEHLFLVEYEIRTKSRKIHNYLDVMQKKYGINDYALSTLTTVNLGMIEIYPHKKIMDEQKYSYRFFK